MNKSILDKFFTMALSFSIAFWCPLKANAGDLDLSDTPLFVTQGAAPLTMLVMGRDHKMYYEAYNDASDLNGDGVLDITYKPDEIDYYGYFDSYKCYAYSGSNNRFNPVLVTANKKCSGYWSGDFLNYITTARIDALRKVLYGGSRYSDSSSLTVLQRSHIPQDAHSWGKEYRDIATSGYDIRDYTPLSLPSSNNYHLFANTTDLNDGTGYPKMRVITNNCHRIWEWVSIERPVADTKLKGTCGTQTLTPTDYTVRVKVCDASVGLEVNCKQYGSSYKPTGLLHDFGENDNMKFGLLMGSYTKNESGGVLRKNIGSITDEIDSSNGTFNSSVGIIRSIDNIKIMGFGGSYMHNSSCGFLFDRAPNQGECRMWGNPIGEMMYETLRYFSGKGSPTSEFAIGSGGDDGSLNLPRSSWDNPYDSALNPHCARPNMLVLSDINTSHDSDQIPGSYFSSFSGDIPMNAQALGQSIWDGEMGSGSVKQIFIGQSGAIADRTPSAKTVSSFGNIRGLAPEEPAKNGSYYSASVAYYGLSNDLNSVDDDQKTTTYVVANASPVPQIEIPVNGQVVRLVPFAKSVSGCMNVVKYQPTNQIVDFYVDTITSNYGKFLVNFEDSEQGADHDMDAIVEYEYTVNPDNTITIGLNSTYAAGCIVQHMGYVISGTTQDGPYLEVRDIDTGASSDTDYFLDTPPGQVPGAGWNDSTHLPLTATRTFTPGASADSAELLNNPLWYAAKWGGFIDIDGDGTPNLDAEWDANGDGVPDTYFLVSNPAQLFEQLSSALNEIIRRSSSASAASLNSGSLNTDTRVYQAVFNSESWAGKLLAFTVNTSNGDINTDGPGPEGSLWDAGELLTAQDPDNRVILTVKSSTNTGIPFRVPANYTSPTSEEMDQSQFELLAEDPDTHTVNATTGGYRLNYIRGDKYYESSSNNGGTFRDRASNLGDIINSEPIFIGGPNYFYPDVWKPGFAENNHPYSQFKATYATRAKVVYVGANDGMMHAFDADTGNELLAFIPEQLIKKLNQLTSRNYDHQYFADATPNIGDVYYNDAWHSILVSGLNKGGQAIFALDVTDPASFDEDNADSIYRWQFSDADDADLGYTFSKPAIVRMNNGKWAAVFGNGYNNTEADGHISGTGNAVLYIVDMENGSLIKKIDTGIGTAQDPTGNNHPNGLASVAVVDRDGDYIADFIYAGDLFGNLWKFDVSSTTTANWDIKIKDGATNKPLFAATDSSNYAQSITSRPSVIRLKNRPGYMQIFFGTGRYLGVTDKSDTHTQTFYSILDDQSNTQVVRSDLLQQAIIAEKSVAGFDYRVVSDSMIDYSTHKGWYMDLVFDGNYIGERVVSDSIVRGDKIIFSTLIPNNEVCDFGGDGWLMELNIEDGGRLDYSPFDLNNDHNFNPADYVEVDGTQVPVSGRKSTVGIIPKASILSAGDTEYKYTPGTSGEIEKITENPGAIKEGRRSWKQLK